MVEEGTIIKMIECPGCGAEKPLKVGRTGTVGMLCREIVGRTPEGKREDCYMQIRFGRTASKRIIDEFLTNQKDITEDVRKIEEPISPENKSDVRETESEKLESTSDAKSDNTVGDKEEQHGAEQPEPRRKSILERIFDADTAI